MNCKKTYLFICLSFFCFTSFAEVYPDLRQTLNTQINNSVINLPKGTYLLDLTTSGPYAFTNKKNVVVNGNGSTIICNKQTQAFQFINCENVVFSNLYIEYDPPCSTQGTITAMSSDKRTWDVAIHDGYPVDNLGTTRIQAYGKNTLELIPNFGTGWSDNLVKTGTRTVRFTLSGWNNNPVQVGDYVALDVLATGSTQPHTIFLSACKNMELDSIVVYDSNCFSFLEYDCEKTHYYRCVVTRKPNDPKYTFQRLRAGIADGIHSIFATVGPIVEECRLEYSGDDCIAIHGNFYPVYNVDESGKYIYLLTTSSSLNDVRVRAGDSIVCVNNDGSIRGKLVASYVSPATPTASLISTCLAKFGSIINPQNYLYGVKVKVGSWISGLGTGDICYSNNRTGNGFKVINNQVGHNRSRAILVKASDGIINGNTITGSAMSGIALAPEFNWMESGCSSNVEISSNIIRNCMFESTMYTSQAGALSVISQNPAGTNFSPTGSLNNISIHDNIVDGCPRPGIVLSSINGVNYYNNTITSDLTMIRNHGYNLGVPNTKDFWKIYVTNFSTISDVKATVSSPNAEIFIDNNANISLSTMQAGESAQLSVYDVTGRVLHNNIFLSSKGFSLASLKKDIYIVSVNYKQQQFTRKIIIM